MDYTEPTVRLGALKRPVTPDRWSPVNHAPSLGAKDITERDAPAGVSWPGDAGGSDLIFEIEGPGPLGLGYVVSGADVLGRAFDRCAPKWRTSYPRR